MTTEWTAIVPFWEATGDTQEIAMKAATDQLDEVIPGLTEVVVVKTENMRRYTVGYLETPASVPARDNQ